MAKTVILLLLLLFVRAIIASSPKTLENGNKLSRGGRHCPKDREFNPVHQVRCGVNVVYQVPLNPRAILLLVHGRTRSALSYFDRSEGCHLCYGLPEDRRQTLEGLRRGYATIAIQSAKYESWDIWPPQDSKDVLNVRTIMEEWVDEKCLQGLPLAALGNSAGGNFSTMVVDVLGIRSLVSNSSLAPQTDNRINSFAVFESQSILKNCIIMHIKVPGDEILNYLCRNLLNRSFNIRLENLISSKLHKRSRYVALLWSTSNSRHFLLLGRTAMKQDDYLFKF